MLAIGTHDTEQADAEQDRVTAVHGPMGMAWCSESRINAYLPGCDFTNKIDMLTLPGSEWTDPFEKFLDLDQGPKLSGALYQSTESQNPPHIVQKQCV